MPVSIRVELFGVRTDDASRRKFLDFRAGLARRMQEEWIAEVETSRRARPELDLVLTHVDDRFDTGMRDAIGADAARVLPLLDTRSFTFLIEDPATVWHLGPERYSAIAERYRALTPHKDKLAIDLNIVERYQNVYPTKQQTGTELFQLVHRAAASFARVALYFENSLLPPDLQLLPSAAAAVSRIERMGPKTVVDSAGGVGIPWTGGAKVDGQFWPVQDDETLWLPARSPRRRARTPHRRSASIAPEWRVESRAGGRRPHPRIHLSIGLPRHRGSQPGACKIADRWRGRGATAGRTGDAPAPPRSTCRDIDHRLS